MHAIKGALLTLFYLTMGIAMLIFLCGVIIVGTIYAIIKAMVIAIKDWSRRLCIWL